MVFGGVLTFACGLLFFFASFHIVKHLIRCVFTSRFKDATVHLISLRYVLCSKIGFGTQSISFCQTTGISVSELHFIPHRVVSALQAVMACSAGAVVISNCRRNVLFDKCVTISLFILKLMVLKL